MNSYRLKLNLMEVIMSNKDEKSGYGKPPKEYQFKPGQSGNPKGRIPGSKNTYTLLQKILDQKISVTESGQQIKISKKVAMLTQLVNKAVQGDTKAIASLLPHMMACDIRESDKAKALAVLNVDDRQIIENYLSRFDGVKEDEPEDSELNKEGSSE